MSVSGVGKQAWGLEVVETVCPHDFDAVTRTNGIRSTRSGHWLKEPFLTPVLAGVFH
jgi:hypothetical protein